MKLAGYGAKKLQKYSEFSVCFWICKVTAVSPGLLRHNHAKPMFPFSIQINIYLRKTQMIDTTKRHETSLGWGCAHFQLCA